MPTYQQLVKKKVRIYGKIKKRVCKLLALNGAPILKGTCIKVKTMKPKKPNSAIRKIARVRLTNSRMITAYIPGIGHNLQEHSVVLVRGGRTRDLPGLHYKLIRGKLDFDWHESFQRRNARSKYGIPKEKDKNNNI